MKRIILICAALSAGMFAVSAQTAGAKSAPKDGGEGIPLSESRIPGIYQLCNIVRDAGGDTKFTPSPFLKIYNADGTFYTVLAMPETTLPAILTTSGTYRVPSEGQLVESLEESAYDSHRAGEDNTIEYVINEGVMYFVFPSGGGTGREAWRTVGRSVAPVGAKKTPAKAKALAESMTGVWQLCYRTGEGKRTFVPIYKIFRADGTFTIVNITSRTGAAEISSQGNYIVNKASQYVECVSESVAYPELVGVETVFECRFADDTEAVMQVTFSLPNSEGGITEEWFRVVGVNKASEITLVRGI